MLKLKSAHAFPAKYTVSRGRLCTLFLVEGLSENVALSSANQLLVGLPQSLAFCTVILQS